MFAWQVDIEDIAEVSGGGTCEDFDLTGGIEREVCVGDVLDDEGFETFIDLGEEDCCGILGDFAEDDFVFGRVEYGGFC